RNPPLQPISAGSASIRVREIHAGGRKFDVRDMESHLRAGSRSIRRDHRWSGQVARRRRGSLVALVPALVVMVVAMAVLAVDVGRICLARSELQGAADAAAMAAAARLHEGPDAALAAASEAALRNPVLGLPLVLADGDVSFGTWDEGENVFTPLP